MLKFFKAQEREKKKKKKKKKRKAEDDLGDLVEVEVPVGAAVDMNVVEKLVEDWRVEMTEVVKGNLKVGKIVEIAEVSVEDEFFYRKHGMTFMVVVGQWKKLGKQDWRRLALCSRVEE